MKIVFQISILLLLPFIVGKTINSEASWNGKHTGTITYPEHIAGAYSGGFGEESCHSCHFDYDLNHPEGTLLIEGIGEVYEPGQAKKINITVKRDGMNRAGFQLTARFKDGSQAGSFYLPENVTTTPGIDNGVTYVQHGVGMVEAENGEKNWQLTWVAPAETEESVMINIAANAANGDASEFGDWIYVRELELQSQP